MTRQIVFTTKAARLMRRRSTIYFKFHFPQLVDQAMRYRESSQEQFEGELGAIMLPEDEVAPPPKSLSEKGTSSGATLE